MTEKPCLIMQFAVLGITNQQIDNFQSQKQQHLPPSLIFSSRKDSFLLGAENFAFPFGVFCKQLTQEIQNKTAQLLMKSTPKKKCFIFTLKPQITLDTDQMLKETGQSQHHFNQLNALNPQHQLYCLCTGNTDFSVKNGKVYANQRCYCLVSVYPYISFIQQILITILKKIKDRRVEAFIDSKNTQYVDTRFVDSILHDISAEIAPLYLLSNLPRQYNFPVALDDLKTFDWILKPFKADDFHTIFSYILQQKKLIFVCENSAQLTQTIFLLVNVLLRPFRYPYPVVYIGSERTKDLLQAPMPLIFGALSQIQDLQPDIITIKIQQQIHIKKIQNPPKNKKIKSIVTQVFQNFKMEKQSITRRLSEAIKNYLEQQIFKHMPKAKQIDQWRLRFKNQKQTQLDENGWLVFMAGKRVKQKSKWSQACNLVTTQMFSYAAQEYLMKGGGA